MSDLNLSEFYGCKIDGEDFILPTAEQWKLILKGCTVHKTCLARIDDVAYWKDFISSHNVLAIGLHQGWPLRGGWWHCVLVKKDSNYIRINLQRCSCSYCPWEGWIGNPVCWNIYIGAPDDMAALNKSRELPKVKCPNCNSELKDHAIWVV